MADESRLQNSEVHDGGMTGRTLVVFAEEATPDTIARVTGVPAANMPRSSDYGVQAMDVNEALRNNGAVYFDELKAAVIEGPPPQTGAAVLSVRARGDATVVAMEPERFVFALELLQRVRPALPAGVSTRNVGSSGDYARGFRDAASILYDNLFESPEHVTPAAEIGALATPLWADSATRTWGLAATRADRSAFTGRGVNVAVLDTGFDLAHPDFATRPIVSRSFVTGEAVQDGRGHGTHCIGTAMGPRTPTGTHRRYGVAGEASIFVGKVLSNAGVGTDGDIWAGIDWAIRNECRIVSMSLGAPTRRGDPFSTGYERIARRALDRGTLIIAAAGNDSERPARIEPVNRPANCPSIMAVGAIDAFGNVAPFSCAATGAGGGEVDIAGPGVAVFSSWLQPRQYRTIGGTSMATPHVAGIAALYLQKTPALTARELWRALVDAARPLPAPRVDVGAGLVQSV